VLGNLGVTTQVRYHSDVFGDVRLYEVPPEAADVRKAVDCDVDGKVVVRMHAAEVGTKV